MAEEKVIWYNVKTGDIIKQINLFIYFDIFTQDNPFNFSELVINKGLPVFLAKHLQKSLYRIDHIYITIFVMHPDSVLGMMCHNE